MSACARASMAAAGGAATRALHPGGGRTGPVGWVRLLGVRGRVEPRVCCRAGQEAVGFLGVLGFFRGVGVFLKGRKTGFWVLLASHMVLRRMGSCLESTRVLTCSAVLHYRSSTGSLWRDCMSVSIAFKQLSHGAADSFGFNLTAWAHRQCAHYTAQQHLR
jgi:hypothetical protein